ncbi:MAG: preprotein translocase subunit YajC [Clostridiales bacterium]|nr:preprotein translocase subunit YajC [Clostridiales bacterium]
MFILSAAAAPESVSMFPSLLMIVVMIAVFYFLLIRPENKKKKAADEMRSSLKVGDTITTIGGIVGTICAVKDQTVVLETGADRVRIEFTKWAISSKGTQSTEEAPMPEKEEKKGKKSDK